MENLRIQNGLNTTRQRNTDTLMTISTNLKYALINQTISPIEFMKTQMRITNLHPLIEAQFSSEEMLTEFTDRNNLNGNNDEYIQQTTNDELWIHDFHGNDDMLFSDIYHCIL